MTDKMTEMKKVKLVVEGSIVCIQRVRMAEDGGCDGGGGAAEGY